uniref:Uncharacterized protein n=1 Tax=Nelumbo nucifera TaxID=4432 RepID=A0A822ZQA6_NELNU|nr:TPA_asm: hypothetical protein HUJ06_002218 [Nelumbo nucifera]
MANQSILLPPKSEQVGLPTAICLTQARRQGRSRSATECGIREETTGKRWRNEKQHRK